jgi:AraC-like DNA-binding protein
MHTVALVDVENANNARAIGRDWRERFGAANDDDQCDKIRNRYDGAASAAAFSDARAAPVTVAVGHSASLISAGLVATLARTPGCELSLRQISPAACICESAEPAQLVFGDSRMLKCMQAHNKSLPGTCKFAKAKFVLVTSGDDRDATGSGAGDDFDECLSLDSPEQQIFATVRRLIGLKSAPDGSVAAEADAGLPTAGSRDSLPRGGLAPGALRRVRDHIEQNLTASLRTEVLATVAGLSPGHFSRAFRQSTGQSPHQYVLRRRVAVAAQLLKETGRALADIALEVGFADQSHFTRTYALVTGETPSACRRRHR